MQKLLRYIAITAFITILVFILICFNKPLPVIGIQPFEKFNKSLIDTISYTINKVYGFKVIVLPEKSIPKTAFINIKTPRYRADSLIYYLKKIKPNTINYIIGLTCKDISTTKLDKTGKIKQPGEKYRDWGIFGLGYRPGPSCIVSTYRLKNTNNSLFILRLRKVCIHELGHNLGLKHCTSDKCVMEDAAETIKTIDYVDLKLCSNCKKYIYL